MSNNFTARRAPNVSAYLANLNTVPSAQDVAAQNEFEFGDDGLDFLTNTEFFDFDTFNPALAPQPAAVQKPAALTASSYQFGEFQTFPNNIDGTHPPSPTSGLHGVHQFQAHPLQHSFTPPSAGKRKSLSAGLPSTVDLEESSRMAAEEDKRRRNTAASARFRVKKKQREQALEKATKEMTDKVSALESKVQQLEMENKWLKELITEKSDAKTLESKLEAKADEAASNSAAATEDAPVEA